MDLPVWFVEYRDSENTWNELFSIHEKELKSDLTFDVRNRPVDLLKYKSSYIRFKTLRLDEHEEPVEYYGFSVGRWTVSKNRFIPLQSRQFVNEFTEPLED